MNKKKKIITLSLVITVLCLGILYIGYTPLSKKDMSNAFQKANLLSFAVFIPAPSLNPKVKFEDFIDKKIYMSSNGNSILIKRYPNVIIKWFDKGFDQKNTTHSIQKEIKNVRISYSIQHYDAKEKKKVQKFINLLEK